MGLKFGKEFEKTDMKKFVTASWAVILIFILWFGNVSAAGDKTTQLKRKITEIIALQQALTDKIVLAIEKKDQLEQKNQDISSEVRDQKEQFWNEIIKVN